MTIANQITAARLVVIPFFLGCVLEYEPEKESLRYVAFGLLSAAAASDIVDGIIARRYHQISRLGKRLDPLADKLLINLGFIFLAANQHFNPGIPLWVPPIILARDVYIVLGAYFINEFYGPFVVHPRCSGKVSTVLQIATLLSVLVASPWTHFFLAGSLGALVWSSVEYFVAGYNQVMGKTRT